jgi:LacI family transcriptional regulator
MQSDGIADGAACWANIKCWKPVFICHDLTRETRGYLVDDLCDVVIDQNARLIAEQSVIRLLGSSASSAPYLTKKFIEPRLIFKENVPIQ